VKALYWIEDRQVRELYGVAVDMLGDPRREVHDFAVGVVWLTDPYDLKPYFERLRAAAAVEVHPAGKRLLEIVLARVESAQPAPPVRALRDRPLRVDY
jgi:hypothetical protein